MKDKTSMKIKLFITLVTLFISNSCLGSLESVNAYTFCETIKTVDDLNQAKQESPLTNIQVTIVNPQTNSVLLQETDSRLHPINRFMQTSDLTLLACAQKATEKKGITAYNLRLHGYGHMSVGPTSDTMIPMVTVMFSTLHYSGNPSTDLKWIKQNELPDYMGEYAKELLYGISKEYKRR